MKIIPTTDFVIQQNLRFANKEITIEQLQLLLLNYALFLKMPLNLGMFIPCDKEGNVLKSKPLSPASDDEWDLWENTRDFYKEAKEKVLFKLEDGYNVQDIIMGLNEHYSDEGHLNDYTVEDLIIFLGLTLTDFAIKTITQNETN